MGNGHGRKVIIEGAGRWVQLERPAEVNEEGRRAVIEIVAPGATMKFHWSFADMTGGATRIAQKVILEGERVAEYEEAMKGIEKGIPVGMEKLVDAMVRAARG
ncbi:MAG TPA: hypothetical protein VHR27_18085 [Blastocatellia bacterium]|nr:hypothetical protein [Blastocatellia bacterium]